MQSDSKPPDTIPQKREQNPRQGHDNGLIKAMLSQGYFDDLPESIRGGFAEQVMKTLPFLRNKLAGHGQGAQIVEIPSPYGELAMQLAAAFHNFLVSKYIEKCTPETQKEQTKPAGTSGMDDEIPF
jgi:hypothetical protein